MGCWHGTCGLSGLPIMDGNPVVAMMLYKGSPNDYTPSYAWELWEPASALVRSKYDDYGGIEITDKIRPTLKLFADDSGTIFEERDGVYGYYDVEPFIVEDEEEGETFNMFRQPNANYVLWLAHEPIFDHLMKKVTVESFESGYKSIPLTDMLDLYTKKYSAQDAEKRALYTNLDASDEMARMELVMSSLGSHNDTWSMSGTGFSGPAVRTLSEFFRSAHENYDEKGYEFLVSLWRDLKAMYDIMDSLRINLAPPAGCGSQSLNLEAYSALTSAMNAQITKMEAYFG